MMNNLENPPNASSQKFGSLSLKKFLMMIWEDGLSLYRETKKVARDSH